MVARWLRAQRLRRHVRAQRHRHRRQDHRPRAREGRCAFARARRGDGARVRRGLRAPEPAAARPRAARHALHRRDAGADRDAREEGPRLPRAQRRRLLLGARLSRATASSRAATWTSCAPASAWRSRRAKRDPLDFALWKAAKPGEPSWPSAVRRRAPRLAHRVLGDGGRGARHAGRPARRRGGPAVPAPRERDRAERGRGPRAVHELLDARRLPQHGQREDVEVARQLLHAARGARASSTRCRAARRRASSCCAATTAARSTTPGRRSRTRATRCAASTRRCAKCPPAGGARSTGRIRYAARFRDAMNDDFDTPIAFAVLHELRGEVNRTKSPRARGAAEGAGRHHRLPAGRSGGVPEGRGDAAGDVGSSAASTSATPRRRRRTTRGGRDPQGARSGRASSSRTSPAASPSGGGSRIGSDPQFRCEDNVV